MNTNPCPLHHKRIIVLREKEKSQKIQDMIEAQGGTALFYPIMDLVPTPHLQTITPAFIAPFDNIIFASTNAVDFFLSQLDQQGASAALLNGKCIIPVGQETANHLLALQIKPSIVPESYSQEGILAALPTDLHGRKILLPNNLDSRKFLEEELQKRHAQITPLAIYQSVPRTQDPPLILMDGDYVVFSSSLTAKYFFMTQKTIPAMIAVAIGHATLNTINDYFQGIRLLARESSFAGTIECVIAHSTCLDKPVGQ